MATRKVTFTVPEELLAGVTEAAREAGIPVSRLVSSALEWELRRLLAEKLAADFQAEQGEFSSEALAAARAEMAAADAEAWRLRLAASTASADTPASTAASTGADTPARPEAA